MSIFIILPEHKKERILQQALSPEISSKVFELHKLKIDAESVASRLELLYRDHDLWCCDSLIPQDSAIGSFFAIKYALEALNLVKQSGNAANLEELHIVDVSKKHGYSPWA